jgi:hypothetical protein
VSDGDEVQDSAAAAARPDALDPSLTPPATRLQKPLGGKERAQLRTESETLAREKKLVQVQVGTRTRALAVS